MATVSFLLHFFIALSTNSQTDLLRNKSAAISILNLSFAQLEERTEELDATAFFRLS